MTREKLEQILNLVKRSIVEHGKKNCPIEPYTHEALLDEFIQEVLKKV